MTYIWLWDIFSTACISFSCVGKAPMCYSHTHLRFKFSSCFVLSQQSNDLLYFNVQTSAVTYECLKASVMFPWEEVQPVCKPNTFPSKSIRLHVEHIRSSTALARQAQWQLNHTADEELKLPPWTRTDLSFSNCETFVTANGQNCIAAGSFALQKMKSLEKLVPKQVCDKVITLTLQC